MSTKSNKAQDIINRLKLSQEQEDSEINVNTENIKNITTGMDIFQLELDKLEDAPNSWNFFLPLNNQKMTELIESIVDNGLLNPIIVWEKDDSYMILSGHNRVRAFKMLYSQTKDEKYRKIHAYIKKKNDISEDDAKTIIIDTNFVQRQLTTIEKTKSIVMKYHQLGRKRRNSEGMNTALVIAQQYKLSERQVYNYYKLNNLIPEFMDRIDKETLSLKAGLKLASLEQGFQKDLYDLYNEVLDNKKIMNLDIKANEDEIINQLESVMPHYTKFSIKVPLELEEEFKSYIDKWMKEKKLVV